MKQDLSKRSNRKWMVIAPILLVIFILPLIVRLKAIELTPGMQALWNGDHVVSDVFSYYKMAFLLTCSALLIVGTLINYNNIKSMKTIIYILLLCFYAVFTILSTIFSYHRDIAVFGFVDRFEGMFTILSYILLTVSCIFFIEEEKEADIIYKGLAVSAAIIGIIGVLQFIGFDIFRTILVKNIITPSKYQGLSDIVFGFKPHAVYSTLQNPNYVGSYMAMLLPISLMLYLTATKKQSTILYGLLSIVVFTALLGSISRAGIIAASVSVIQLIAFYNKRILRLKVKLIFLIACLAIIFALVNFSSGLNLSEGSSQYLSNKRGDEIAKVAIIKDIQLSHDSIKIKSNKSELTISFIENHLSFTDQNNNKLKLKQNGEVVSFENDLYNQYKIIIPAKGGIIRVEVENLQISFAYTQKAGFQVLKGNGTLAAIDYPESIGFSQNQDFASSRGYIWSRTIPILKNTIFIGNGPDTFTASFPQDDFIGKLNVFRTIDVLIDKPHNMYLQTGVNTGMLSLLAIILLFAIYIWSSFKLYRKCCFESKLEIYGFCSFLAVCAYLIVGIINDSVISVAPVFWILLGIGISINKKIQTKSIY